MDTPSYKSIDLKATATTVVLEAAIGKKNITQSDFIDGNGNSFTVFSSTDEYGRFRKINKGESVKVTFNDNDTKQYQYNPYTGKKMNSSTLNAVDIQLTKANIKSIDDILKSQFPSKAFEALKKYPKDTVDEKVIFLKDIVKTWAFFNKEKNAGRLHYRPSTPEDKDGLTSTIEIKDKLFPGKISLQFNARDLEHTFTLEFDVKEITRQKIEDLLNGPLDLNNTKQLTKGMAL